MPPFIEFLLARPSLDLPIIPSTAATSAPPHTLASSTSSTSTFTSLPSTPPTPSTTTYQTAAPTATLINSRSLDPAPTATLINSRSLDGVVRLTIDQPAPLYARSLILRFRGGKIAGADVKTILKLLLWQPRSLDEFHAGLSPGRHDFPFSLEIPTTLHPSSSETTKVPHLPNPGPLGNFKDHFRVYSLEVSLESVVMDPLSARYNAVLQDTASRSITVRRVVPQDWIYHHQLPYHELKGSTPENEFTYTATLPRFLPFPSTTSSIDFTINLKDAQESTSKITLIDYSFFQRIRHHHIPFAHLPSASQLQSNLPMPISLTLAAVEKMKLPPTTATSSSKGRKLDVSLDLGKLMQPSTPLDPFEIEHGLLVTLHVSKTILSKPKKVSILLPVNVHLLSEPDDRLLTTMAAPVDWWSIPPPPSSLAAGSERGRRNLDPFHEKKADIDSLASALSMGVSLSPGTAASVSSSSSSSSPSPLKRKGFTPPSTPPSTFSRTHQQQRRPSNASSIQSGSFHSPSSGNLFSPLSAGSPNSGTGGGGGFSSTPTTPLQSPGRQARFSQSSFSNPTSPLRRGSVPSSIRSQNSTHNQTQQQQQQETIPTKISRTPDGFFLPPTSSSFSSSTTHQQQQQQQKKEIPNEVSQLLSLLPPPPPSAAPPPPPPPAAAAVIPAAEEENLDFQVSIAYTPTLADELKLEVGETVRVLEVFDDGWARGCKLSENQREETGYFPVRCLKVVEIEGME
ncbi:hypothetical protein HDV05_003499 [Chytridiales sp. JEL 0842]|nr:hypothetical protein HDV05_003499 [Chytridiales sp. JEL 0842]